MKFFCRVNGEMVEEKRYRSQILDGKDYLNEKMAHSVFDSIKVDLEKQMENILHDIVLDLRNEARSLSGHDYRTSATRYKRDLTDLDPRSMEMDRDDSYLYRSTRRRKPMRKSGNNDRRYQRINERKSKRLQVGQENVHQI